MVQISSERLSSAIGLIYEAGYDPEQWTPALAGIGDLFHAARTCIGIARPDGCVVRGSYDDHLFETLSTDPLVRAMQRIPVGNILRREAIHDERAFRRRPLWLDWMAPREMDMSLVCNLERSSTGFRSFDVSRSGRMGAFTEDELGLLRLILPHLNRALEIGQSLDRAATATAIYDDLPFGMMVLDTDLRARYLNAAAEALLADPGSPLSLRNGRAVCLDPFHEIQLRRLVKDSCAQPLGAQPATGGDTTFHRPANGRPEQSLAVSVAPLAAQQLDIEPHRYAAVLIRQAERSDCGETRPAALTSLFDLSPSEAALALALADGKSLKDIAGMQGIRYGTARKYLEGIFSKTGTHRQGELVALLLSAQAASTAAPETPDA